MFLSKNPRFIGRNQSGENLNNFLTQKKLYFFDKSKDFFNNAFLIVYLYKISLITRSESVVSAFHHSKLIFKLSKLENAQITSVY